MVMADIKVLGSLCKSIGVRAKPLKVEGMSRGDGGVMEGVGVEGRRWWVGVTHAYGVSSIAGGHGLHSVVDMVVMMVVVVGLERI